MRIDLPCCNFKRCKYYLDGNCIDKSKYESCEKNGTEKYINWLENMTILLAKCYQQTHDMLLEKAKNKETDAYFSMPTVEGIDFVFAVDKISKKAKNDGTITGEELEGYVNWLIEQHEIS